MQWRAIRVSELGTNWSAARHVFSRAEQERAIVEELVSLAEALEVRAKQERQEAMRLYRLTDDEVFERFDKIGRTSVVIRFDAVKRS